MRQIPRALERARSLVADAQRLCFVEYANPYDAARARACASALRAAANALDRAADDAMTPRDPAPPLPLPPRIVLRDRRR